MSLLTDSTTIAPQRDPSDTRPERVAHRSIRLALLGNPNTGKTTLFNRLCGIRSRTANFPGSTVEARIGVASAGANRTELVDLPGAYSLAIDRPEATVCRGYLDGDIRGMNAPDGVLIILDASNLQRNLIFACEALRRGLPSVIALNMVDIAQRRGLTVDAAKLSEALGVPVVSICARSGEGLNELRKVMREPLESVATLPDPADTQTALEWADKVVAASVGGQRAVGSLYDTVTDRIDAAFTHPVLGVLIFILVMGGLFWTIFAIAEWPMTGIEVLFAVLGDAAGAVLPPGAVHDMVVNGIVPGIAGAVVFLPQICLLFFLISLLEDTGYLARAAFVMDRLLRRFGLPGQSFVPLLSAHACAIPAIMSARLIPDQRERLATILVAPFMSCSARLPVYVLLIGILFAGSPMLAALAFVGCYALGAIAAVLTALIARRTILRGPSAPMVLELPTYKMPSIRTALLTTWDRGTTFLRKAGTVIVAICIVLWWLGEYPRVAPLHEAVAMQAEAEALAATDPDRAAELDAQASEFISRDAKERSFVGRMGRAAEPVFAPLGYDWRLTVGVMSSLLAREVFVSTMAVVLTGEEDAEDERVIDRITGAERDDGTLLFTTATSASLLVYYVLAMQCLPTLAVTRRETGSWKWAGLQLVWMTGLAYVFALIVHQALRAAGVS